MNENLIQVLWVEDDPQITLTYPLEAAQYGIQLVPFSCWEDAEKAGQQSYWMQNVNTSMTVMTMLPYSLLRQYML